MWMDLIQFAEGLKKKKKKTSLDKEEILPEAHFGLKLKFLPGFSSLVSNPIDF